MAIIGLLLILAAGAVTAGAIYDGGESATIEVFGLSADTTIGGVFVVGLATMLVFFLGVWMLFASMGRSRRKRLERKETRNRQRQSVAQMEEERAQLRAENERLNERLAAGRGSTTTGTAAGATAAEREGMSRPDTDRGDPTRTDLPRDGMSRDGMSGETSRDGMSSRTDDGRVIDHTTDLRDREETASTTSGRHRDV
jgi:cell division protein FtsB